MQGVLELVGRYVAAFEALRWLDFVRLVAIAFVWSRGSLFKPLREHGPKPWRALHGCPMCVGVWAALLGVAALAWCPRLVLVFGDAALVGAAALAFFGFVAGLGPQKRVLPTAADIRTMLDIGWLIVQGIEQIETWWHARRAPRGHA